MRHALAVALAALIAMTTALPSAQASSEILYSMECWGNGRHAQASLHGDTFRMSDSPVPFEMPLDTGQVSIKKLSPTAVEMVAKQGSLPIKSTFDFGNSTIHVYIPGMVDTIVTSCVVTQRSVSVG